jgi:predicted ABC-type ATPase
LPRPRMTVVAGPPGSGKSTRFPLSSFNVEYFNADDRAAGLNGGSYHKISKEIRTQVNLEFQQWIIDHIRARKSFAIETTLRSPITFEQARLARGHGFWTSIQFVSAGSVSECVSRVMERSYRGGHSASERLVREIYDRSMRNLLAALDFRQTAIDVVRVYDNSLFEKPLAKLIEMRNGRVTYVSSKMSLWLEELLRGTEFNIQRLRAALKSKVRGKSDAQSQE